MEDRIFKKNFIWNMIGTTLNTFNSMFFMIIITRINGTEQAGIFTLLFSVACLLYNIGIYSGRTFQVTDKTQKYNETEYFINRLITVFLMLLAGIIYCCYKKLDKYRLILVMLLTLMKALEALADCLYGIMQKNEKLYKSGISLTVKALGSLLIVLLINLYFKNIILSFIIVDLFCFVVTIVYDFMSVKDYFSSHFSLKKSMFLLGSGFYAFAYFFLNIYLSNAPKYALDGNVTSSEQALFSIILMPATLISLCAVYLLQPYINRLSIFYLENKISEFRKAMRLITLGIIGIGIVCFIGATILGIPVLNFVYNVDLSNYLRSLQLIIVGGTLYAIVTILSTALTTFRNTKIQFYIYLIVSLIILFISSSLVHIFGVYGGAYIYILSTILELILYYVAYHKNLNKWIKKVKE